MNSNFCLLDLVSQAVAVQKLLRGCTTDEKLTWLSQHGTLVPFPRFDPKYPQVYAIKSRVGLMCAFFIDGDEFVFMGDHTTFVVQEENPW